VKTINFAANDFRIIERARQTAAFLLALAVASPAVANAQTITNSGANRTQVNLGFTGIVRNSVMLTVTGAGTTTITGSTSATMPVRATGTVDFGSFSTLLNPPPANASASRVALPSPGAVVAARLNAIITYNGAATATITVGRVSPAGGAPDVPLTSLRVASPALAFWSSGTQGTQVPDAGMPGYNLCTAAGDLTCQNGKAYTHSLAIFVPDTQKAGPFTTAVVYSGTMP
jgi:hypothetical protein